MEKKTYFSFLILCAGFLQGNGALPDKNIEKSPNLLLREKRVVNGWPNGNWPVPLSTAPYIVAIVIHGRTSCAGSILHPRIIITTGYCVSHEDPYITTTIYSGSTMIGRGIPHNITRIVHQQPFPAFRLMDDLAILKVSPPIVTDAGFSGVIEMYGGPINWNDTADFISWGSTHPTECLPPDQLMRTLLPLLTPAKCSQAYHRRYQILGKHICALDRTGRKGSGDDDTGGPLVYRGYLLGVFAFRYGPFDGRHPEIFLNLNFRPQREWVHAAMYHLLVQIEA